MARLFLLLALVGYAAAFHSLPTMRLIHTNSVTSLKCQGGSQQEAKSISRRSAVAALTFAAGSALIGGPNKVFAAAAAKEEDEEEDVGQGSQQREVTYTADDKVCEQHPKWKQCRKKNSSKKGPLTKMDNGLSFTEITVGKGISPAPGDTVTVHYSLYYNGDEIESSRESSGLAAAPLGFQYAITQGSGSVIPAINNGIEGMKVGGVRRVIAPPQLAFGDKGKKPRIPPGATVEFDLQLLTVKRAGTNPISSQGKGSEAKTGLFDLF